MRVSPGSGKSWRLRDARDRTESDYPAAVPRGVIATVCPELDRSTRTLAGVSVEVGCPQFPGQTAGADFTGLADSEGDLQSV